MKTDKVIPLRGNIVLIGMMGSGKTTLGRLVGQRGGFTFIDIDDEIVNRFGMTIPHIFEQYGESYFRKLESGVVEQVSALTGALIAAGGGTVTVPRNMDKLRERGMIIYLRCPLEVLYERTIGDSNRPLLNGKDSKPKARIEGLLKEREPLYLRYADLVLDTDSGDMDELAEKILVFAMEKERRCYYG